MTIAWKKIKVLMMGYDFELQLLLSSSMDKTVKLWDLESRTCLNTFTHNDYGESEHIYELV